MTADLLCIRSEQLIAIPSIPNNRSLATLTFRTRHVRVDSAESNGDMHFLYELGCWGVYPRLYPA